MANKSIDETPGETIAGSLFSNVTVLDGEGGAPTTGEMPVCGNRIKRVATDGVVSRQPARKSSTATVKP